MKFAAFSRSIILTGWAGWLCVNGPAQGLQVDAEEFKRLQGEVADLRDANVAYRKQISDLTRRIERLQEELREGHEKSVMKMGDFATREELKKIVDRIGEVDQKRENDRKVILEEFEKLGKTLASAPSSDARGNGSRRGIREREKETEKQPDKPVKAETIEGNFLPYKVKPDQTFGEILQEYNEYLKKEGRPSITTSMVKKANPKLNPDRIFAGQEILLPVPDKK